MNELHPVISQFEKPHVETTQFAEVYANSPLRSLGTLREPYSILCIAIKISKTK